MIIVTTYIIGMITVNNVKFHSTINGPRKQVFKDFYHKSNTPAITKRERSFLVLRQNKVVYTCFKSGFINVTGVRSIADIQKTIEHLAFYLGISGEDFSTIKIDNIHASCTLPEEKINLRKLIKILPVDSKLKIKETRYNRQRFPGLTIKTKIGSILWFSSNKVLITGCNSQASLTACKELIDHIYAEWINAAAI